MRKAVFGILIFVAVYNVSFRPTADQILIRYLFWPFAGAADHCLVAGSG